MYSLVPRLRDLCIETDRAWGAWGWGYTQRSCCYFHFISLSPLSGIIILCWHNTLDMIRDWQCTTIFKHADTNTKNTFVKSIVDNSCTNCLVYIIAGSVVGIIILLVICALLIAVMICITRSNRNSSLNRNCDYSTPESPVYECIPVYGYLNPTLTSVMTENEAYNTCCDEIRPYDIV